MFISQALHLRQTELILRGSRDGISRNLFWDKCCGKGPILILMRSKNSKFVFGGCTIKTSWPSLNKEDDDYKYDTNAYLFSLTRRTSHRVRSHMV
jgi:hypothetical protein